MTIDEQLVERPFVQEEVVGRRLCRVGSGAPGATAEGWTNTEPSMTQVWRSTRDSTLARRLPSFHDPA